MNFVLASADSIAFGRFRILPHRRVLLADDEPIKLGGRAFDLLMILIESAGAVVSKDDLMARVWPGRVVTETNLQTQILALRRAFGTERDMIRTIAGRGYQFTGEIHIVSSDPDNSLELNRLVAPAAGDAVAAPTNLPQPLTELIGRDAEVEGVLNLARAGRLVTLTGAGGIGKTRLALAVARRLLPQFPDGVCLIEFSPLTDPGLVPATVAAAAGLDLGGGEFSAPRVALALASRRLLLVMDTCEHVIDAAATMAEAVLRAGSAALVIATSREPLRAEGEQLFLVPPLAVPTEDAPDPLEFGAARLFVERARAGGADLASDPRWALTITAICRRLDGIPLAIEMAAARVPTLGLEELARRLDDRLPVLSGGRRTALPRHQTLRATFDWSHELLAESERVLLRRLAVFAGAFGLQAADAVAASADIASPDIVDGLSSLVAKSLVVAEVDAGGPRYRLLDITRAYALEKLVESGESERLARRNAEYCRDLFERADAELETDRWADWLWDYGRQIDNLRAALDWALSERGDRAIGVALAALAAPLLIGLSSLDECRRYCERALVALRNEDRGSTAEMILQEAVSYASMFTRGKSSEVRAALERGLDLAAGFNRQLNFLAGLSAFLYRTGDFRGALAIAQRASAVAQRANDRGGLVMTEWMLGIAHHCVGNQADAEQHLQEGMVRAAGIPGQNPKFFGYDHRTRALVGLAGALWLRGYANRALRTAQQAIDEAAARGRPVSVCMSLYTTQVFFRAGYVERAGELAEQLIEYATRFALDSFRAVGTALKAELAIAGGEVETGVGLLRQSLGTLRSEQHNILYTVFSGALTEGLRKAGRSDEALMVIDGAIDRAISSGAALELSELLRLKAEVLAAGTQATRAAAIDVLEESMRVARAQTALAYQLRSATTFARLFSDEGHRDRARDILAPVYERFTEGFETPDLRIAHILLRDLA